MTDGESTGESVLSSYADRDAAKAEVERIVDRLRRIEANFEADLIDRTFETEFERLAGRGRDHAGR
jgi:hypothetical protein